MLVASAPVTLYSVFKRDCVSAGSDMRPEAAVPSEEDVPTPADAPVIMLGPLEHKSCVDELSDGVQSMDVR